MFLDCTRYCFHSINVCLDTVHKHSVHTYTCTHTQRHTTNTHTTCISIQTTVDEAHAFFWKKRGVSLKITTEAQHVTFGTHSQESVLITTSRNPHPLAAHTTTTETTSLGREMLHVTNYSCMRINDIIYTIVYKKSASKGDEILYIKSYKHINRESKLMVSTEMCLKPKR